MTVTPLATAEVGTGPDRNPDPASDSVAALHVVPVHVRLSRDVRP